MTQKYTFTMIDDESDEFGPGREISHTIVGEQTWPDLLVHIEGWLRGVGYIFEGELQLVMPDGTNEADKVH